MDNANPTKGEEVMPKKIHDIFVSPFLDSHETTEFASPTEEQWTTYYEKKDELTAAMNKANHICGVAVFGEDMKLPVDKQDWDTFNKYEEYYRMLEKKMPVGPIGDPIDPVQYIVIYDHHPRGKSLNVSRDEFVKLKAKQEARFKEAGITPEQVTKYRNEYTLGMYDKVHNKDKK